MLIDLTLRLKDYPSLLTSTSKEMHFKNPKIQRTVASLILISLFLPSLMFLSLPKQAEAAGIPVFDAVGNALEAIVKFLTATNTAANVTNTAFNIKKFLSDILKEVLKTIAKRALAELSKSTVNWINSGFHGKPLFLESPDSFFKDITKFEIKRLVDTLGYNSSLYPYGRNWSLGIIGAYKRQIDYNAAYSLSLLNLNEAIDQANFETFLQNYRSNFNIGGWNGLTLHTQYPQNNAFGFQMRATEELARRINTDPNANNEIGKTKSLLQQGQGFLSPQVCRSNPDLVQNPYNPPTFKFDPTLAGPFPDRAAFDDEDKFQDAYNGYLLHRQAREDGARIAWESQNTCTGGWANTTPGYVAASQITRALGSKFSQNELGQALGVSLSAIFDALLSKLFETGLNALASKSNPEPENEDNWDYLGNTLGSPDDNPNRDIFSGPDQEIILQEFKDDVQRGITDTKAELALLDNPNSTNYGAIQMLSAIWPRVRQLDLCLPGPNYGWEGRLNDEMSRASVKIQEKVGDENSKKSAAATLILKELQFAASFFKDWVRTKIMQTLPSSILFLDAIDETEMFDQQIIEITDSKRFKAQALARLEAIAGALSAFTTQPTSDTPAEKDLIKIKKQYNLILYQISNPDTLEESKAQLDALKDKLASLNKMVNRCATERVSNGWNIPAGECSDPDGRSSFRIGTTGSETA